MMTQTEGLLAMEWGFVAHEKGMNLQMARIEFNKLYETLKVKFT